MATTVVAEAAVSRAGVAVAWWAVAAAPVVGGFGPPGARMVYLWASRVCARASRPGAPGDPHLAQAPPGQDFDRERGKF